MQKYSLYLIDKKIVGGNSSTPYYIGFISFAINLMLYYVHHPNSEGRRLTNYEKWLVV